MEINFTEDSQYLYLFLFYILHLLFHIYIYETNIFVFLLKMCRKERVKK